MAVADCDRALLRRYDADRYTMVESERASDVRNKTHRYTKKRKCGTPAGIPPLSYFMFCYPDLFKFVLDVHCAVFADLDAFDDPAQQFPA